MKTIALHARPAALAGLVTLLVGLSPQAKAANVEPGALPGKGAVLLPAAPAVTGNQRIFQYQSKSSRSCDTEKLLAEMSKEVAGKVFYQMKDEGQNAMSSRLAVVCAVPLSDLKRETEFGRMVAEYYLTDLADRGIQVKELRLGKDINIIPQSGEFILSQNVGELASESPALDYVVVSTFSNTRKSLILQGRMVSLQSGLIKTSWRYAFPLNRELVTLLDANPHPFTISVKGVGNTMPAKDTAPKMATPAPYTVSSAKKRTKGHK